MVRWSLYGMMVAGLAAWPAHAAAQDAALDLSANVRARFETLDGQARAGLGPSDELFSLRTIVSATLREGDVTIGAELYDSRAWGEQPGSAIGTGEVNALELVQAYVAVDLGKVKLQAGRLTLNLGSRRLVAADEYRNTTNGYTGLRADIRTAGGTQAVLIYTLPQLRLPDDPAGIRDNRVVFDRESFDLQLFGGLVSRPKLIAGATGELGYFGLAERDSPGRPTRDRRLHSISGRLIREPAAGRWDFEAEAIYQFGNARTALAATAPDQRVSASFVHADLGYSFAAPWKPRLAIEYDRASGDAPGGGNGRFDTLFGMRRADLAPAGIYAQIGRANISTPGVRIEAQPDKRLDGFAVYRALWLAEATDAFSTSGVRDPSGRSGSFAGHQFEGRVRWWVVPDRFRAEFNGALLLKRGVLLNAPNAQPGRTVRYASFALTASF